MPDAEPTRDETDIVTKLSARPVNETVSRLTEIVGAKGMKLFAVIDQSAEARQHLVIRIDPQSLQVFEAPVCRAQILLIPEA